MALGQKAGIGRRQKVIEEAPSPVVSAELRALLARSEVRYLIGCVSVPMADGGGFAAGPGVWEPVPHGGDFDPEGTDNWLRFDPVSPSGPAMGRVATVNHCR